MEQISQVLPSNSILNSAWTFIVIGISLIIYLFYTSYVKPMTFFRKLGIKGPAPRLIIGNLLDDRLGLYHTMMPNKVKYGKIYGTYFGTRPTLWVADLDMLKIIMVQEFHNFTDRVGLNRSPPYPVKHSLFFATGENWKRIRSILSGTFSTSKLKQVFTIIDKTSDRCVERLLSLNQMGETPDLRIIYGKLTMEIITATGFGIQVDNARGSKLVDVARTIFDSASIFRFLVVVAPIFVPVTKLFLRKRRYATKYLTDAIQEIIHERRTCLQNGTPCNRDLLQLMIEATENGRLTDDEIVGQSYIFMVAGYETTANTLTFATYLLATHPEVQERLYQEIAQKYEEKGSIDYETISELPYLEMVLSETLRMYPPGYVSNRNVIKDTTINGVPFKKEMAVTIPIYGIHHDPEYWPNPEKFDPERFTSKNKQGRHPFSYMPFGAGPRNCIGMRLALVEAKLALVKIIKAVEFFAIDKTEIPLKLSSNVTLNAANPVYVGVKKRS